MLALWRASVVKLGLEGGPLGMLVGDYLDQDYFLIGIQDYENRESEPRILQVSVVLFMMCTAAAGACCCAFPPWWILPWTARFYYILLITATGKETKTPIKPSIWTWETHNFAVHVSKLRLGWFLCFRHPLDRACLCRLQTLENSQAALPQQQAALGSAANLSMARVKTMELPKNTWLMLNDALPCVWPQRMFVAHQGLTRPLQAKVDICNDRPNMHSSSEWVNYPGK